MTGLLTKLLPLGLAFIMFALGLKLSIADFRRVVTRPTAVALGLIAQMLLLPLTAFAIVTIFELSPEAAVGIMILAACPGGVSAGMITYLSRGDTCLSITLTAATSLLSFVSVPIVVGFSLQHFLGSTHAVDFPILQAGVGLFVVTLVPVTAGILVNQANWLTAEVSRFIGKVATGVFFLIVVTTFVTEWPSISDNFSAVGPAILLLNLVTMGTGALLGTIARLPVEGRIALAVECGIQNSALGITVALSLLSVASLAVPSVIYAFLMNISALTLIAIRQAQAGRAATGLPSS
ncbi:MAG: bile acid:sodium symporter family protein [Woeseiaceae bacterium]|nr:bile acid:sodium symporter family protein [Woeseiaceae bacterium]